MSSYKFDNDLIGNGKPWGHHKDLLPWQRSVYNRYMIMCHRCNNPKNPNYKNYGAKGIENHFISLSQYYNTLKKDPLWQDFKKNPDKYEIDKDIKYGHGVSYEPGTVAIVTKEDNLRERNSRCSIAPSKKVVVVFNNRVCVYPSGEILASSLGISHLTVSGWIHGHHSVPSKYGILRLYQI